MKAKLLTALDIGLSGIKGEQEFQNIKTSVIKDLIDMSKNSIRLKDEFKKIEGMCDDVTVTRQQIWKYANSILNKQ